MCNLIGFIEENERNLIRETDKVNYEVMAENKLKVKIEKQKKMAV